MDGCIRHFELLGAAIPPVATLQPTLSVPVVIQNDLQSTRHSTMESKARLKPSELRNSFALAKTRAARFPAAPRLLEYVNAGDHTTRVSSSVPLHKPLFEPSPTEIWIDDYTPFQSLNTRISFRNCDSVARRLRIEVPSSPLFKIHPLPGLGEPGRVDGKIAAGMETAFMLEFSPQEVREIAFDLVCCTERERFALPVRVRGRVTALDIPDEIHFGCCPVKIPTSKVIVVRNVGSRDAKFAFETSENFRVAPEHSVLVQGEVLQLELCVTPPQLCLNHGELSIHDDTGQTAIVQLTADVTNLDVYINAPLVESNSTYISLTSRKTIKICNDSDYAVDFEWKALLDSSLEQRERERLLDELASLEAAELEQVARSLEGVGTINSSPFHVRKAIENKYRHLKKAATDDRLQFVSESFAITPLSGRVWPNSEVDVVICFSPANAVFYTCGAFLEIGGQESRMPLQLRGQGIGPKAKVVYNELLDFGEVYITEERTRDFTIQNKGEIPALFEELPLIPEFPDGMSLRVFPHAGSLSVNEMVKIEVTFCSLLLGEVLTPIRFRLKGSEEQLVVRLKANVVPPVFRFDVDQIDFGSVSYSFLHTTSVKLLNSSNIEMDYRLHIPDEINYKKREYEFLPSSGRLEAYGEASIQIRFLPMSIKTYDYRLAVQVAGIPSDLVRIPIKAQSMVPEVTLQNSVLDFGVSFLRYSHKQTLMLHNRSTHLKARFEVVEQDDHSRAIASYTACESCGTLQPDEKLPVEISLSCEKIGPIRLPMSVSVLGSTDLPLPVTLTAIGTGPRVQLDQSEVNWGSCTCLVDHERVLTMTNTSLIPASFKTFIRNARSKFQIDQKEGVIPPGGVVEFKLIANLDDTVLFRDTLHVLVTEGDNLVVPLSIKGTGTTMWSMSELKLIDFGHQLTNRECEWCCTLENKGKRSQVLTWSNRTIIRAKQAANEAAAVANKIANPATMRQSATDVAGGEGVIPVFSVFPATIELKPRTACVFVFKAISIKPGVISEELICETRVGKEKNSKVAFTTEIRGDFQNPKLEPSSSVLQFAYVHDPCAESVPRQTQQLSLTNKCALPLAFTLRTQPPFSLDCWEAELQPGEMVKFSVEFYPGFKDDHQSRLLQAKIAINYVGHPQKDSVDLIGDISFPNLMFDTTKIDFGCSLNDTQKSILVLVTNTSKVDASFRWVFVEDEREARSLATLKKPYIPVNQIFDVLPIRGLLRPGESEKVEFLFYGHANRKFKSVVVCEVEGGPEYEISLHGEASSVLYRLDKQSLDFGQVLYNKVEEREFAIFNIGKVPFTFSITVDNISRGRSVVVTPIAGKIPPNDRQRVLVQVKPGIPENFEENILIEIAHFQPVGFKLFGSGVFTAVCINLPREDHPASTIGGKYPKWQELKKQARQNLEISSLSAAAVAAGNAGGGFLMVSESKSSVSSGSVSRTIERGGSFTSAVLGGSGPRNSSPSSHPRAMAASNIALRSGVISMEVIDDLDVEIEASRMFFAEHLLLTDTRKMGCSKSDVDRATMCTDNSTTTSALDGVNTFVPERKKVTSRPPIELVKSNGVAKPQHSKTTESNSFLLSQFVLDFGNIVLGTHKTKKFSVINIGHTPISFQLDKNLAQSRGFQIEPERVVRLPEKQLVEFAVTFQAHKSVPFGRHQVQLPILIKNGPPSLVTLRATVTIPDVVITVETLDFGKIPVGTCHTIFTQLHNVSCVPAEWAIKKPLGSARDILNFRISPQHGTLGPGNKINLQVDFVPEEGRLYALKIPVKVASNSRTRSILMRGEGAELRVRFSPPIVDLGPTLPCSHPTEQIIELFNDSDYAVEVFSLDFDVQYREEEKLLSRLPIFEVDDIAKLTLRSPGRVFDEYLIENGYVPKQGDDDHLPVEQADFRELTEIPDESTSSDQQKCISPDRSTISPVSSIVDPSAMGSRGIDYVVMGPPRSGKSTQAKLLGDREDLRVWCVDDAVEAVATDMKSALGRATRVLLGLEPTPDLQSDDSGDVECLSKPRDTDDVEHPLGDSAYETKDQLLERIVRWRLSDPDVARGSVLDGWENSFFPIELTVRACAKVMQTARIIWLHFDEDTYDSLTSLVTKSVASDSRKVSSLIMSAAKEVTGLSQPVKANNSSESLPNGNDMSLHTPSDHSDEQVFEKTDPSVKDDLVASVRNALRCKIDKAASSVPPYTQYTQNIPSLRRLIALFVARDRKSMCGMDGDDEFIDVAGLLRSDKQNGNQSESDQVDRQPLDIDHAELLKSISRADNCLVDIPVLEAAPPLTIHSVVTSTLDKFIHELELCHLEVPPSVRCQLVRRPHERFSRKPVKLFTLHHPSVSVSEQVQTNICQEESSESCTRSEDAQQSDSLITAGRKGNECATRWILGPQESTKFVVQFSSSQVGNFECSLGFEIVGVRREFSLFCRGTASVPHINTDPRNVFMNRIKSRGENTFVQKKFVLSKNQFEFGPLIVPIKPVPVPRTEDAFLQLLKAGTYGNNIEIFRISNISKYPLRVDIDLARKSETDVFSFAPQYLELLENETKEIRVWACPTTNGHHENSLVCCVSDNPEPVFFAMRCFGCTPCVVLRGPWEESVGRSTTSEPFASSNSEVPAVSEPISTTSSQPNISTTACALDFEQLLIKRQDEKTFFLENVCPVAVTWRIMDSESLPTDFRLHPLTGVIKPFQMAPVLVNYTANVEAVHSHTLVMEYSDVDSALQVDDCRRTLHLTLRAEAYKTDVCSFETDDSGGGTRDGSLDFGLVRVGEVSARSFVIKNRGKYEIKFAFSMRTSMSRELFKVDPMEMVLEPDKKANVQVTFHTAAHEVALRDNKDIKCTIIEMLSGESCADFHVLTSVRAVFSIFRIQPSRGINFGPLKYNEKPKVKRIEVRNDGEFTFKFRVSHCTPGLPPNPTDMFDHGTPLAPSTLTAGQFQLTPDCGTIDPGTTGSIEVLFQPKSCSMYREIVRFEISGRNPKATDSWNDAALKYELLGESCYPAIETNDFDSIFEEQIVVHSLNGETHWRHPTDSPTVPILSQAVIFAERERVFSFGAMIAAGNTKGSVERFKISNPTKIATNVHFQISPAMVGQGEARDESSQAAAFSVQPTVWEIPPLEHRFVNVHFKPTAIMSYRANFTASVKESPVQPSTESMLQFELRGEGTMPCITIVAPSNRDINSGALLMPFGRVRLSKSKELPLIVRNDGVLAATVLFSLQSNPNFVFPYGNGSVVIPPQVTEQMTVQFKPQKAHEETVTSLLKINVQNNPFEETCLRISGQGYREDLIFEDLPYGHDDELHFEDIILTQCHEDIHLSDTRTFTLSNQSTETVRYEWACAQPFTFSPSVGHLKPGGYKLIKATFTPMDGNSAHIHSNVKIQLLSQRIVLSSTNPGNAVWDNTTYSVSFDASDQNNASTQLVVPEPPFEITSAVTSATLTCFAAADKLSFHCDVRSVTFKRTFMLQVCSHKITVDNLSKIKLAYAWRWVRVVRGTDESFPTEGINEDDCPFDITPAFGEINAEGSQSFLVRFSPMEVGDFAYDLHFDVSGQDVTTTKSQIADDKSENDSVRSRCELIVKVCGSSIRPACHFDVERSDYPARRSQYMPGPTGELGSLDPSIRVIEMESLGVRVKNTKRFYVVNPTNISYEFAWISEGNINPSFRCATPKGLMLAGKRCEMVFEFTPQHLELQETFWRFSVPHFQVSQLFLLVGTTSEPRVTFDRGSVNFNTLMIGTKTSQTVSLVNHEHIPFNFVFDKTAIDFAGEAPALIVHPLSGIIPPNGRLIIDLEFVPREEKSYNFNLNCIIKRKPARLSLNVKGEGYTIHDALAILTEGSSGEIPVAISSANHVDFGAVRLHERSTRSVVIHNAGHDSQLPPFVTIEPPQGTVKKNDRAVCIMVFNPTKPLGLDSLGVLNCTIAGTRHYAFHLHGSAVPPSLQFSFTTHDFGPCFIADVDAALQSEQVNLIVMNVDPTSSVDLDCLFEKKPYMRVDCAPTVIGPRETTNIPIVFTARHEILYHEMIPFVINGASTVLISVRGEGIFPKLELSNSSMQLVSFGSLQIGQNLSRSVKVVNRSRRRAVVKILDDDEALQSVGISVLPTHDLSLKPKETADVEFRFVPTQRIAPFQHDVFIQIAGSRRKLLRLSGSCLGMEVQLESDTLSFGTVCLGSQLVRKVHLQNRGDIPAKFEWSARSFAPDYSITPLEGTVNPNNFKVLEVTFKPTTVNAEIKYERLVCAVEGTNPLLLTLVGTCIDQITSSAPDIFFDAPVRQETMKTVIIENRSGLPWKLQPVVQGEHWSCPDDIAVPADGKAMLSIVYKPRTMTRVPEDTSDVAEIAFQRPEQHEGSIFLAIPDGSALLYKLFGKAKAPLLAGSFSASTPAKKSVSILIPVTNWLKHTQLFTVTVTPNQSPSVITQGAPTLCVQPSNTRNYNLKLFSYKEGIVSLTVHFLNANNGEYLEYEVQVTVTKASEIETIRMESPVRQSTRKFITIENPFPADHIVRLIDRDNWWKCSSPHVRVRQLSELSGRPEGTFEVEYRPLVHQPSASEESLVISFVELGEFTYKLILTTQGAGVEQVLQFKTPLGGSQLQVFSFVTYSGDGGDMACSVQHPTHFSVPTILKIDPAVTWDGNMNSIQVKFEPERLGDIQDTLVIQSETMGEYRCLLHGTAVPPLPQGPFVVLGSRDFDFKNVFSTNREFEFVVDNPMFVVNVRNLSIPAKTSRTVNVKIDSAATKTARSGAQTVAGRLLVSCPSMRDLPPWVYYLEATHA